MFIYNVNKSLWSIVFYLLTTFSLYFLSRTNCTPRCGCPGIIWLWNSESSRKKFGRMSLSSTSSSQYSPVTSSWVSTLNFFTLACSNIKCQISNIKYRMSNQRLLPLLFAASHNNPNQAKQYVHIVSASVCARVRAFSLSPSPLPPQKVVYSHPGLSHLFCFRRALHQAQQYVATV